MTEAVCIAVTWISQFQWDKIKLNTREHCLNCEATAELSPFYVCVQRAVVQMDEAREQHITKLLNSVQNDQPGPERDGRASTSGNWRTAASRGGHW